MKLIIQEHLPANDIDQELITPLREELGIAPPLKLVTGNESPGKNIFVDYFIHLATLYL